MTGTVSHATTKNWPHSDAICISYCLCSQLTNRHTKCSAPNDMQPFPHSNPSPIPHRTQSTPQFPSHTFALRHIFTRSITSITLRADFVLRSVRQTVISLRTQQGLFLDKPPTGSLFHYIIRTFVPSIKVISHSHKLIVAHSTIPACSQ
jgi:hypothetical protein